MFFCLCYNDLVSHNEEKPSLVVNIIAIKYCNNGKAVQKIQATENINEISFRKIANYGIIAVFYCKNSLFGLTIA